MTGTRRAPAEAAGALVWDLPLRLFHWTLAALVVLSIVTAKAGGVWMDWHMRSGYVILGLLLFRVLWGFAGSDTARFVTFLRPPRVVFDYLRGRTEAAAGHSPPGGWSVIALLGVLLLQGSAGLFSNDGSFTEGPLARLVSSTVSDRLSTIHRYGEWAVFAVVGLHLAAIAFYAGLRRKPLIRAMVTGRQPAAAKGVDDGLPMRLRAAVLAALAAAVVAYVVTL